MKSIFKWALVVPLIASVSLVGCNKDDDDDSPAPVVNNPVEGKMLIFENYSIALKVLIFYFNSIFSIVHFTGGLKR